MDENDSDDPDSVKVEAKTEDTEVVKPEVAASIADQIPAMPPASLAETILAHHAAAAASASSEAGGGLPPGFPAGFPGFPPGPGNPGIPGIHSPLRPTPLPGSPHFPGAAAAAAAAEYASWLGGAAARGPPYFPLPANLLAARLSKSSRIIDLTKNKC